MTVDLAIALPTLVAGATLIALVIGGILKIRKWIEALATASRATAEQLETSDDLTIADHVQNTTTALVGINRELNDLHSKAAQNAETATAALTLATFVGRRLDEHLVRDHGRAQSAPPEQEQP